MSRPDPLPPTDVAARLQQLAGEVALQLVGQALAQLLPGPRSSDIVVEVVPRKALPPAPRVKRKYTRRKPATKRAPKPQTSAPATKAGWSPARRRKFLATIAAKGQQVRKPDPAPAGVCKRCGHDLWRHGTGGGACAHIGPSRVACTCESFYD